MNWTCEGLKSKFLTPFFYPHPGVNWTCEGLKQNCSIFFTTCVYFGVNWTCEGLKPRRKTINIKNCSNVWIEPVRDWNGRSYWATNPLRLCVNWTCEGLKPPTFNSHPSHPLLCVNWTCEGLKPPSIIKSIKAKWVWIEPVRDWNRHLTSLLSFQ